MSMTMARARAALIWVSIAGAVGSAGLPGHGADQAHGHHQQAAQHDGRQR
jgi:hypothetical protein